MEGNVKNRIGMSLFSVFRLAPLPVDKKV